MSAICGSCPWRVGATADPIPGFNRERATCSLPSTVGDGSDAIRPIMACHLSGEGDDRPCGGYLVVVGWTNIAVRLAVISGRMEIPDPGDIELVDSFDEMLAQVAP